MNQLERNDALSKTDFRLKTAINRVYKRHWVMSDGVFIGTVGILWAHHVFHHINVRGSGWSSMRLDHNFGDGKQFKKCFSAQIKKMDNKPITYY